MLENRHKQQTDPNSNYNNENPLLWTHVVRSKRKGNNNKKNQSIVSFNPTLVNLPVTEEESSQNALNGSSPPAPIAVIRPFIKGMEQDSVFIDLTPVKDRSLLNKALLKFNEDAENIGYYEDFLGYRKQTRNYLGYDFLETMWLYNSVGRKTLIEEGITLEDGTFVKGFPSYPADATIVRLTLENLPFLPAIQLKEEMAARLSCFGEVLDHGISRTDGIFHGTLNLTLSATPENGCMESHAEGSECPRHRHLEPLSRVIIWDPCDNEQRKVLLQWDKIPDFCRSCQRSDHCRADCPNYKKWVRCYHCNETGHVMRNCSRNGSIDSAPSKVRAVEKSSSQPKPRKGSNKDSTASPKAAPKKPMAQKNASAGSPVPQGYKNNERDATVALNGRNGVEEDTTMNESNLNPVNDSDAVKTISKVIVMEDTVISSPSRFTDLETHDNVKRMGKFNGTDDISAARQQAAASAASQQNRKNDINNVKANVLQPDLMGQQSPQPQH
ncbi:uncharacterized protein B0P05DRAFT_592711 [Gilbertella persicaria]|uniref:uncharacterized protein n=1 Tax=Gilbertella persicaria TaxID=101096 RepID=UPI00221FB3FB|nr:uncharacterized protein B0P05DRAFT_592711 [Gilbertella persicaria]KAI8047285.1 hypothetical protein B0P05DRAFT_592711 [Gilbertella persicaria]